MIQEMRQTKQKKKGRYLTPLLFILNVFIWGIAIYLWTRDIDVSPQMTDNEPLISVIKASL